MPPRAMLVRHAVGFIRASSAAPIAWCELAEYGSTSTRWSACCSRSSLLDIARAAARPRSPRRAASGCDRSPACRKPCAPRRAIAWPMRPMPRMPSVAPWTSLPVNMSYDHLVHSPRRSACSLSVIAARRRPSSARSRNRPSFRSARRACWCTARRARCRRRRRSCCSRPPCWRPPCSCGLASSSSASMRSLPVVRRRPCPAGADQLGLAPDLVGRVVGDVEMLAQAARASRERRRGRPGSARFLHACRS